MYYQLISSMNKTAPVNPVWSTLRNYYSLNNSVSDLKGSYNGTLNGAVYSGDSVFFDGINDFVSFTFQTGLTNPDFSVNFWVKLSSSHQGVILDFDYFTDGYSASWSGSIIQTKFTPMGFLNTSTLNLNQWYMISYTQKQTEAKFYLDGSLIQTVTTNTPYLSRTSTQNLGKLGALGYFFNGYLKKYSYFTSYLTQSDITTLYDGGNGLIYI